MANRLTTESELRDGFMTFARRDLARRNVTRRRARAYLRDLELAPDLATFRYYATMLVEASLVHVLDDEARRARRRTGQRPSGRIPDSVLIALAREIKAHVLAAWYRDEPDTDGELGRRNGVPVELIRAARASCADPLDVIAERVQATRIAYGRGALTADELGTLRDEWIAYIDGDQRIATWRRLLKRACKYRAKSIAASGTRRNRALR